MRFAIGLVVGMFVAGLLAQAQVPSSIQFIGTILFSPSRDPEVVHIYITDRKGAFAIFGDADLPVIQWLRAQNKKRVSITIEEVAK